MLLIFKGIHAPPEAIVFVCQKSLFIDEALERLAYQLLALPNVAEYFIPHCEEPTVYPNICLAERLNFPNEASFLRMDNVETCGRLHQQQGSHGIAPAEGIQHCGQGYVAETVTIVREKHFFILYIGFDGL